MTVCLYCCAKRSVKYFDKSVNKSDFLKIINLQLPLGLCNPGQSNDEEQKLVLVDSAQQEITFVFHSIQNFVNCIQIRGRSQTTLTRRGRYLGPYMSTGNVNGVLIFSYNSKGIPLQMSNRGRQVVKKGQKFVNIVKECPLMSQKISCGCSFATKMR